MGSLVNRGEAIRACEEGKLAARSSLTTDADVDAGRSAVLRDMKTEERREGGVVVVRWPEEIRLLEHFVALGMPRLLVVADDTEPPEVTDTLEDWIRLSADDRDRQARMATLRRLRTHELTTSRGPFSFKKRICSRRPSAALVRSRATGNALCT